MYLNHQYKSTLKKKIAIQLPIRIIPTKSQLVFFKHLTTFQNPLRELVMRDGQYFKIHPQNQLILHFC